MSGRCRGRGLALEKVSGKCRGRFFSMVSRAFAGRLSGVAGCRWLLAERWRADFRGNSVGGVSGCLFGPPMPPRSLRKKCRWCVGGGPWFPCSFGIRCFAWVGIFFAQPRRFFSFGIRSPQGNPLAQSAQADSLGIGNKIDFSNGPFFSIFEFCSYLHML